MDGGGGQQVAYSMSINTTAPQPTHRRSLGEFFRHHRSPEHGDIIHSPIVLTDR